jgi:hypothetical protein
MSTTTGSPGIRTVRRITRSGNVARVEPAAGVVQPSTHSAEAGPLVGGGRSGTAGGVGEAEGLAGSDGNALVALGDELFGKRSSEGPSHAARRTTRIDGTRSFFMRVGGRGYRA